MDKTIKLEDLSINEVNTIIFALGKRPFEEVYELIGKIQTQARAQVQSPQHNP